MKKFLKVGFCVLVMFCAASMVFAGGQGGSSGGTEVRLGIYPEADQPSEVAMHQEFIKRFNEKHPNVRITPAQYRYQLDTFMPLAQSGRLPTIFETWFTETEKLINGNFIRDITAEVKARGWDTKMNAGIRDIVSKDGKIYGVPRDGYALGLYINVPLFRQAGLVDANGVPAYPKTWAEFVTVATRIKERTGQPAICLLAKDNAGGWHFSNIAWAFGARFVTLQGNRYVANMNSAAAVQALTFIKELKWTHDVLTADPTNEDWGTGWRAIGTGTAAMYIGAHDGINQINEVWGLPVGDVMLAPLPAGPGGQFSLMGGTYYTFARNATTDQVNAALDYLEIMGRAPIVSNDTRVGLMRDAARRKNAGIPVIPEFPAWDFPELIQAKQEAIDMFSNVNMRLYNDYYATIAKSGNVRAEELFAQDVYAELTKALQEVITNRNADPKALLDIAQRNVQTLLNAQ